MNGTKNKRILVCPLNWGLGHATRCIPIINYLLEQGHSVIIAATGKSGLLLKQEFPQLQHIELKSFSLSYSKGKSQVGAMARALPSIVWHSFKEHRILKGLIKEHDIDVVISDNRFGLWNKAVKSVYITHQLMIKMPRGLQFLEGFVHKLHLLIIKQYSECLIPDDENLKLSGDLAHKYPLPPKARFIGILSRYKQKGEAEHCDILCLISGIEPQRSIFEQEVLKMVENSAGTVCIVQGLPDKGSKAINKGNVRIYPYLGGEQLARLIRGADKIICRSGYSSIMDLQAMGKLSAAELHPTPGQTEQEYLAALHNSR